MAASDQKASAGQQWGEAEIEKALKRLAKDTFEALQESSKTAYSAIQEYKQAATNEETSKVFERAKQSRQDNPKGIKPWRARDDPDWLGTNT
ncbi:hypothetical protein DHEL01_v202576 [Diaporthe helianthi]|uniref:Uncharacterized protein n=1 Tax=Diaporthe helianthi TaxID=158607 RepID=A0A2P5I942_DIAHE|nr:hypothetical protein DHEL01_v202576 [Diaporthe helianthi]